MSEEEIVQYRQCSEEWKYYDSTIWQMPTTAITIASGIITISYQFTKQELPRTITLFFGCLTLFGLTVALIKHRLFQAQRIKFLIETEKDWLSSKKIKHTVGRLTKDIGNVSWYQKISAYYCLLFIMIVATLCLFSLFLYNLILLLS